MKKISLIIAILFFAAESFSQTTSPAYKVVSVISKESFYLNGGARAMVGGRSRTYLQVTLPPNTVEWYYALTSTPNQGQNSSIGLASQLLKLIDPVGGVAESAISSIITPTGAGVCDVFLMSDQNSVMRYVNKQPGQPQTIMSATRENFRQGVVNVKDIISGTHFLVFRNPSAMQGINLTVEVAAIVRE